MPPSKTPSTSSEDPASFLESTASSSTISLAFRRVRLSTRHRAGLTSALALSALLLPPEPEPRLVTGRREAEVIIPRFHSTSTSYPPLVLSPRNVPARQSSGKAGRRRISTVAGWGCWVPLPFSPGLLEQKSQPVDKSGGRRRETKTSVNMDGCHRCQIESLEQPIANVFAQVLPVCSLLRVPVSALQQHLVHSRQESQVAVDLEHCSLFGH